MDDLCIYPFRFVRMYSPPKASVLTLCLPTQQPTASETDLAVTYFHDCLTAESGNRLEKMVLKVGPKDKKDRRSTN